MVRGKPDTATEAKARYEALCGVYRAPTLGERKAAFEAKVEKEVRERMRQSTAHQLVQVQVEDEALWSRAHTCFEAYLQQALRLLHAAVEGEPYPTP